VNVSIQLNGRSPASRKYCTRGGGNGGMGNHRNISHGMPPSIRQWLWGGKRIQGPQSSPPACCSHNSCHLQCRTHKSIPKPPQGYLKVRFDHTLHWCLELSVSVITLSKSSVVVHHRGRMGIPLNLPMNAGGARLSVRTGLQ